jgi:acyl-[acyl-carrier-protein]-phospholipid O-acyltransferase/long-chain-fatty-acid--[acyl-carrier-protein] ligase
VALTHRNVLANTAQFAARLDLKHDDSLLGCLPLFHSFGCTVTLWYPVIEGVTLVTFPSPLEVERIAALVQEHRVSLLLSTPTFLRGYLKKAKPEQLAPLKMVITGAEKLPVSLAEAFEKRFGHRVLEGYGLTETSPVTNFNLPNLAPAGGMPVIPSHKLGSVGQFVPGLAVRVTDPVTDEVLPPDRSGILWFKGANVFNGYLNWGDKNREFIQDGWFRTGDIGRIDDEGFLYIEGRLSRFSKIGGEMVPHERVEEYLIRALGHEGEDIRKIVVVGVPDPAKGEALVLLSMDAGEYLEQEMLDLRYRLLEMNVPALWIPRKLVRVPEIPVLASGKLDLRSCETLARKATGA